MANEDQTVPRQVKEKHFEEDPAKFVRESRNGPIQIVDDNGQERAFIVRPRLKEDGTVDLG